MTNEELRNIIVEECDNILNLPRFHFLLTTQQKKIVRSQRNYWANANDEQLTILMAQYRRTREPKMAQKSQNPIRMENGTPVLNLNENQKKEVAKRVEADTGYKIDWSNIPWDKLVVILRYAFVIFFSENPMPMQAGEVGHHDMEQCCQEVICNACCTLSSALHLLECHDHEYHGKKS